MLLCWVLVACAGVCSANNQQIPLSHVPDHAPGLNASALVSLPTISHWTSSPNGEAAAINLKTYNTNTKSSKNELWILPVNAQFTVEPRPISEVTSNTLFAWLSNTTLAILRPTGETSWDLVTTSVNYTVAPPAYPPTVGPIHLLRSFPVLVHPARLAYSSGVLALVTNAYDDEDLETIPEQDIEDVEAGQGWTGGWVYEGTWPRHWDTWTRRKQPRLFLMDLQVDDIGSEESWSFKSTLLRTPLKGTGISPTDIKLASTSMAVVAKDPNVHKAFHTRTNVYLLSLFGSAAPTQVSSGNGGLSSSPVFNGDKIAWLEQAVDADVAAQRHIWMFDRRRNAKWRVDVDIPFNPHRLEFSLNGEALFLLTEHHTDTSLYHTWTTDFAPALPVHATLIPTSGTIHETVHVGITTLEHSHLISLKSFVNAPPELYMTSHSPYGDPDGNLEEIRLTHFGGDLREGLSDGEVFWVRDVQSRIFLPKSVAKVPLLVLLHDGPEGSWKNEWTTNWHPNVFTTNGFAVLQVNVAGSSGYSPDFAHPATKNAISDLEQVLRYVLEGKYASLVDSSRFYALGFGYGGYLVNWINGHNEEFGFRALVTEAGIFSTTGVAYEVDEVHRMNWVLNTSSEADIRNYWDPQSCVEHWKTPTLVIHSGRDYRVPESQGIATYNALQRQGIQSRMLYFPTEGHVIEGEENVIKWYHEVLRFLHDFST